MGFLNIVLSPIEIIFEPIVNIGKAVLSIIKLVLDFIKIMPKLFSLFEIFTDPIKIFKDLVYGIKTGFLLLFDALFGNMISFFKNLFVFEYTDTEKSEKECLSNSFVKILILVLCPPLSLFIQKGLTGLLYVLVSFVLTYFYYIPGFLYTCFYVL